MRTGHREAAAAALARMTERAQAAGTPWGLGLLARCQALMSVDEHAEARYRESIELLSQVPVALDLAHTRLLFGEWLRRRRRRGEARAQLRAAHQVFDSCGAVPFAERARAELLATGEHVRKRAVPARNEPDPAGTARRGPGGRREHKRGDRGAAVHHGFYRGVPPEQGVPEARNLLAPADRRADSPLSRAPGRCGMIGRHDGQLSQAAGEDARGSRSGCPGRFQVSPDGERVIVPADEGGDDPVTCLWELHRGHRRGTAGGRPEGARRRRREPAA